MGGKNYRMWPKETGKSQYTSGRPKPSSDRFLGRFGMIFTPFSDHFGPFWRFEPFRSIFTSFFRSFGVVVGVIVLFAVVVVVVVVVVVMVAIAIVVTVIVGAVVVFICFRFPVFAILRGAVACRRVHSQGVGLTVEEETQRGSGRKQRFLVRTKEFSCMYNFCCAFKNFFVHVRKCLSRKGKFGFDSCYSIRF